ncbi:hypothetical protein DFP72DRAFT_860888 [Ephemerocybe angulata]|uniref:Uncharacterized protein n=1 Tax=Ephemerocybe angulata TaxID=980116 RepID=A0A8H6LVD5_9AGAR|nr:hypothetical protein DFP72DRAFT_860888 [Tulosesus angulatus]
MATTQLLEKADAALAAKNVKEAEKLPAADAARPGEGARKAGRALTGPKERTVARDYTVAILHVVDGESQDRQTHYDVQKQTLVDNIAWAKAEKRSFLTHSLVTRLKTSHHLHLPSFDPNYLIERLDGIPTYGPEPPDLPLSEFAFQRRDVNAKRHNAFVHSIDRKESENHASGNLGRGLGTAQRIERELMGV